MADAVNPNRIGRAFDRAALERLADWLAVAVAVTLPWSTSISQILIVAWLVALVPTLDVATVRRELQTPAGVLPVLLWLLALVGVLWANVPFAERIAGLGGFHKLLIIPLLLAQFRRSPRGWYVLYGFLASCVVLLIASAIVWLLPFHVMGRQSGVPVRDYIAQSTEFLICIFALLAFAFDSQRERRWTHAAAAALLALAVPRRYPAGLDRPHRARRDPVAAAHARLPAVRLEGGRRSPASSACAVAALAWTVSPFLRERINRSIVEVQLYQTIKRIRPRPASGSSCGKRRPAFVAAAPAIGHGTGSIPDQYRRVATGEGVTAIAANNPHNQIFAVAIQLGMLGVAMLMTMWVAHLALFSGAGTDFLARPRDRDAEHRLVTVQFAPVRLVPRLALRVRLRRARRHGVARGRACAAHASRGAMTKPPARILVVALRRLGDVLLVTPLIRSLKRAWPDAAIDALVFAGTEGILAGNPDLHRRRHDAAAAGRFANARAAAQAVAPLRPRALDPGGRPPDLVRLGGRPPQRRLRRSGKARRACQTARARRRCAGRARRCIA